MTSQASSFSLSVDRPDDGPLVISVRGALALPTNAQLLADCLTAVGAADRQTIVDLAASEFDGIVERNQRIG